MTAILSSSFLQFIILREMEYITGSMNGALLGLRGTLENAQKEEWKKYLNSQLCAYDCAPTTVRLRLCAYECAPTSARLRVRAYECAPTTARLPLRAYNYTPTTVRHTKQQTSLHSS